MNPNLIIPWVFLIITTAIFFIPNSISKKKLLIVVGFQVLVNVVALVIAITNLTSIGHSTLNLGLSIAAIVLSCIFILGIIGRRLQVFKDLF
ncbi:hypothetical protein [[Mycoplasma] testudinis]|uniref:hypothetical protein n=1 Tax=[Mycoplasma] testudinis TaxID=33924 RepID=UPI000480FDE8|nr:hypothetical protein [[Mycoplasma] testudinis]